MFIRQDLLVTAVINWTSASFRPVSDLWASNHWNPVHFVMGGSRWKGWLSPPAIHLMASWYCWTEQGLFFFIAFSLSRMKFPRHPQLLWSGVKGGGRKEGGRGTDVQSPIDACYFQEQKMDLPILSRIWFCSARNGAERVRNTTYRQYCGVDDQLGRLSSE